jgi:hypothetical protein
VTLQTCRRHPHAGPFMATCSGCAQDLYDIAAANRAAAEQVRAELAVQPNRRPSPAVLRLRTAARAQGYNPDQPDAVAALGTVAGIDTDRLTAVLTGRAPIPHPYRGRLHRALGLTQSAV